MTKQEFLKNCTVCDSAMDKVKHIHPKQLISHEISIPIWEVYYSYCTARNNHREAYKYIIDYDYSWDRVYETFILSVTEENEKHPESAISNVEILETTFLGEVYLNLE